MTWILIYRFLQFTALVIKHHVFDNKKQRSSFKRLFILLSFNIDATNNDKEIILTFCCPPLFWKETKTTNNSIKLVVI